jgi:reverse gyrase
MQRIWLEATTHGMWAQPLAGLIYLGEYLQKHDDPDMSTQLKWRVKQAHQAIREVTGADKNTIAMILRVGVAAHPPTAWAMRMPPRII